ncbi:MAG: gamma carbonic anhydrase family protein [Pyrinomonadaceae bacterium]|nr:gamma carbonic anhydrase family protein [Pyrinomonadaceae bacterium]
MIRKFRDIEPRIHESVFVAEDAVIIGDVEISEDSSVWYGCVLRGDVNHIRIGSKTNIQDMTMIHVSRDDFPTIVGDEVTVGHKVTLHGCEVEDNTLIGIGTVILDGAKIGRHSLVAAGSLVTPGTIIPERSLVMGSPARVKREMTDEEVADLERFWKGYVELSGYYS